MPLEFRKENDQLVWIQNPFTGTITYFTDIHRKRSGFQPRVFTTTAEDVSARLEAEVSRRTELEATRQNCPFCPGNEHLTTAEVLRVDPHAVPGAADTNGQWLIRVFPNLIPRIPECCTGGRNESYVVVEDPRHFADDARHHEDLLYSALLPPAQIEAVLRTNVDIARLAYRNPAVKAVLIRKNQGRESGASQPHLHNQVIGCDRPFPPVRQESATLAREPRLWQEILAFVEAEGFVLSRRDTGVLYFCPFGIFPRSYEIVFPDQYGRITEVPPERLDTFARLLHEALEILGPLPLDYEIHDGPDIPLHAHVSARHFPYSNIGGTLNLPSSASWSAPPPATGPSER